MSDILLTSEADDRPQGLLAQRSGHRKPAKGEAWSSFWRMLALVWPHRRAMGLGMLLGIGVAMTYAATLGGMLPVLKVVVEQESLRTWLQNAAEQHAGAWYAGLLHWLAPRFPAEVTPAARMNTLIALLAGLLTMNLIGNALRAYSQYLVLYASHRVVMDLRRHLYRKALHVPMTELLGDVSGRVSHFMSDVREIFLGIATLFGKVAREPLKAVFVLIVALMMDWKLTTVLLVIGPVAIGLLWYFGRKVRKATMRLLQGYGFMLGALEESLQGIDTVKGYAREGHERRRMWQLERRMMKHQLKLAWIEAISSPLIEIVGVLVASFGIVWLASRVFTGEIDPSRFMTMVILLTAMLDPVRKVANVYNMVQRSGGAATRLFEFLDQPEEHSPAQAKRLPDSGAAPAVSFRNITFSYDGNLANAVLHDVSLDVQPGECLAVVGPNGSGKSTLLKLLPRLLDIQAGDISIDDTSVSEVSLRALRRRIALVAQRPVIFARSARENLIYGHEDATDDEIREACRKAFAAEFIEAWPDQYETTLGQFGTSVSGGQRQRIAIARAFLKPASILIFDEATSEIDAESERKIHTALDELRRGKTTFLIAHRHTVMDMADRIVVMDAGRIVDVGAHAELIERCPLYVALYRSPAA